MRLNTDLLQYKNFTNLKNGCLHLGLESSRVSPIKFNLQKSSTIMKLSIAEDIVLM